MKLVILLYNWKTEEMKSHAIEGEDVTMNSIYAPLEWIKKDFTQEEGWTHAFVMDEEAKRNSEENVMRDLGIVYDPPQQDINIK